MFENSNGTVKEAMPKTEVVAKAKRKRFTAAEKLRILREVDACQGTGEVGALLRREGIYSSYLTTWRRQREAGELDGLAPRKRGPKPDPQAIELAKLRRENARLQDRLERAEFIIDFQKKVAQMFGKDVGDARSGRSELIASTEQLAERIGVSAACQALAMPKSSLYRTRKVTEPIAAPAAVVCPRALPPTEKAEVRQVLNSERFADQPPREVYATLLDEGTYLCSWRTMYRILEESQEVQERRNQLRHPQYAKPELLATQPNQLWSWDITKLLGPTKWTYYYLYNILDVFSRYSVGWMIAERESAALAEELIAATCVRQGIEPGQLTIHADRGSSMTSKPVALLMADLGVTKTHSRPHVSNDNPFSESQFKTLKYRPDYPERFGCQTDARTWAAEFFRWYNYEHHHSALGLLTPADVHFGRAQTILEQRQTVLQAAYLKNPERFVKGLSSPAQVPSAVWINPPQPASRKENFHL
ncbi:MAG: IS3 family transposase [Thiobacillaceae bacterium]